MTLDNNILTDQGRAPLQVERDERSVSHELASGKIVKYVKAVKHKFTVSWTWLPSDGVQTLDGGLGRNDLVVFGESGDTHVLHVEDTSLGGQDFTVFVDSYRETLTRRDPGSGLFFWEVEMELIEQ